MDGKLILYIHNSSTGWNFKWFYLPRTNLVWLGSSSHVCGSVMSPSSLCSVPSLSYTSDSLTLHMCSAVSAAALLYKKRDDCGWNITCVKSETGIDLLRGSRALWLGGLASINQSKSLPSLSKVFYMHADVIIRVVLSCLCGKIISIRNIFAALYWGKSQWYHHGESPVTPRECLNLLWPLYLRFEVLSFWFRWVFRSSRYAWSLSGIFSRPVISTRHLSHGPCSLYNETQNNGINLFYAPTCLRSQAKSHSPNSLLFNDQPNARKGLLLILGY